MAKLHVRIFGENRKGKVYDVLRAGHSLWEEVVCAFFCGNMQYERNSNRVLDLTNGTKI